MRAQFEDVKPRQEGGSFAAYWHRVPHFEFLWHYHPEFELTYVRHGQGRRLVGDSFADFGPGDLVLLGPHLPHTWDGRPAPKEAEAVVIQFAEVLTRPLQSMAELSAIGPLLARSSQGLHFPNPSASLLHAVAALPGERGPRRVLQLIAILAELSQEQALPLASAAYSPRRHAPDAGRLNQACAFIAQHASRDLTLAEVSAHVHLSPSAFCKFFKRTTGSTYSDYLNELRIAQACRLLAEGDQPIAAISLQAGFESLTYFNRVFKAKKGVTPRVFRQAHSQPL